MRRRKLALIPLILALVAGAAYAAFLANLPGKGTATTAEAVAWLSSPAPTSNDPAGSNDPSAPGSGPSVPRHGYDLATTTADGVVSGVLTYTTTGTYSGYGFTGGASVGPNTQGLSIQNITVADDTAAPGSTRFPAGTIVPRFVDGWGCGKVLSASATDLFFEVAFANVAPSVSYKYLMTVSVVPTTSYVAAACTHT